MTLFLMPDAEHADEVSFIQYTLTKRGTVLSVAVPSPVGRVSDVIAELKKLYRGYTVSSLQALPVGAASPQKQNYN